MQSDFNEEGHLYCRTCSTYKSVVSFTKRRATPSRRNRAYKCRACAAEYRKSRDKVKQRAIVAAWKRANPERVAEHKRRYSRKNPGAWRKNRGLWEGKKYGWVVYRLTFPSGQFYLGSTCQLASRIRLHRHQIRHGTHSARVLAVGSSKFKVEVLFEGTQEEVHKKEADLMFPLVGTASCLNTLRQVKSWSNALDPNKDGGDRA